MKLHIDEEKKICLGNRDFQDMVFMLDTAIQQMIPRMMDKGMDAGSVTLKIDFALTRDAINDNNAPMGTREGIHPEITYKIGMAMQSKAETKGEIAAKGSDELLMDDSGAYFIVSREEASGQLSMFNSWDEFQQAVKP